MVRPLSPLATETAAKATTPAARPATRSAANLIVGGGAMEIGAGSRSVLTRARVRDLPFVPDHPPGPLL